MLRSIFVSETLRGCVTKGHACEFTLLCKKNVFTFLFLSGTNDCKYSQLFCLVEVALIAYSIWVFFKGHFLKETTSLKQTLEIYLSMHFNWARNPCLEIIAAFSYLFIVSDKSRLVWINLTKKCQGHILTPTK